MNRYVLLLMMSVLMVSSCVKNGDGIGLEKKLLVGMSYKEVTDILGEPESNIGFGVIKARWKIREGKWFIPVFERDKIAQIIFSDKDDLR